MRISSKDKDPGEVSRLRQDAIRAKCAHPSGRGTEFPREAISDSIVARFESIADQLPQRLAVKFGEETLTYRQLDDWSNRVAWALLAACGDKSEPVAMLLEYGVLPFVGLMAVLKAGKFYVPLEVDVPHAHNAARLRDAGAVAILSSSRYVALAEQFKSDVSCVVNVDDVSARSAERPHVSQGPDEAALITYTSGSTGQSKGVLWRHAHILHMAYVHSNVANVCPEDRISLVRHYGYNGAIKDVFCALMNGASLFPFDIRRSGLTSLPDWLLTERITIWYSVATTFRNTFALLGEGDILADLRFVLFGGETVVPRDIQLFQGHCGPSAIMQVDFASGETGPICRWLVEQGTPFRETTVPTGFSVEDKSVRLLDDAGCEVPAGSIGEITVSSRYLPDGYWRRPDLTQRVYREAASGQRTYFTGDLGKFRPDGCLVLLGRRDSQLKIRGRRIEPAEIERVLLDLGLFSEVAVAGRPDGHGEVNLVAYLVARSLSTPSVSDLHRALKPILPDYLIPTAFVMLDAFPLTSGNKLDRNALPEPEAARRELADDQVAAQTPLEEWLATIWCEVLDIPSAGVHDDFFEMGGDSLQAMRMTSRLSESLDEQVHVALLFEAPVLQELADKLAVDYPAAVARKFDTGSNRQRSAVTSGTQKLRICRDDVAIVRQEMARVFEQSGTDTSDHPSERSGRSESVGLRGALILSPPRSGSTLLRAMLAGHPSLFAPPELHLLSFSTLAERHRVLSGPQEFRREGAAQALMTLSGCEYPEACRQMDELQSRGITTAGFYRQLQELAGSRLLVDKTPNYAYSRNTLRRAETMFEEPLYLHLVRHPCGAIVSYDDSRLAERSLTRRPPSLSPRQFGECLWLICHQHILNHLRDVPAHRQLCVHYESLVRQPRTEAERICQFLGVAMQDDVLNPYEDSCKRMTTGAHPGTLMIGDPKFHTHQSISTDSIDRWQDVMDNDVLSDATWELASKLGYTRRQPTQRAA